ncbi:FAD-dependent oxidoreductase [Streptomyces sp. TRM70308]|uniref:FAD-dependent oxidoreductase n=1 Tax=Streptomyces sp. TRM70308 TaxID=3131932 RepID=UPI003D034500
MANLTSPRTTPQTYDVIVAGGGSAGVAAAVAASRAGARTLLLERGPCLGGASTLRNVLTYCGIYTRQDPPRQVVFGIAEEVLAALRAEGAVSPPQRFNGVCVVFDPEAVKRVLDGLCAAAGVDVRLYSHVAEARRTDGRVTGVRVADHQGVTELTAAAFVDATGEADLAAFAGAAVRYGNDGMVQNGSLGVRFGGIPRHVEVTRERVGAAVRAARARGVGPLLSAQGLVARLPVSGDVIAYLVDEGYDARDAADVSRAEASARAQARAYLEVIRSLDGCADAYIVSTGPEIGTRESRHIVGRYQLSAEEVLGAARFAEAVAVGAWPVEYHPGPGVPSQWHFIDGDGHFEIPLDALRSIDTDNLFAAGRNVDGDRLAGGSVRVMGTAFATGQAAGIAAALTARDATARDGGALTHAEVRAELLRQGARFPEPAPVPA